MKLKAAETAYQPQRARVQCCKGINQIERPLKLRGVIGLIEEKEGAIMYVNLDTIIALILVAISEYNIAEKQDARMDEKGEKNGERKYEALLRE